VKKDPTTSRSVLRPRRGPPGIFSPARADSSAHRVVALGVVNFPVVNYLSKVGDHTTPPSDDISLTSLNIAARRGMRASAAQHDRWPRATTPSSIVRSKMQFAKTEFLRAHKQLQKFFA
jgi:hypothetical protein